MIKRKVKLAAADIIVLLSSLLIFGTPLYFLVINSFKSQKDARALSIAWPETFHIGENFYEAFSNQNYLIIRAFGNSVLITFFSVLGLICICAMAGYVIQRRK